MRTRKWSTLLAALVLTTGLSSVVQAADYTQGLTGVDDDKPYETGPIVKSENIDETRVGDVNGVVSINVTEAQDSVAASAPSAM